MKNATLEQESMAMRVQLKSAVQQNIDSTAAMEALQQKLKDAEAVNEAADQVSKPVTQPQPIFK